MTESSSAVLRHAAMAALITATALIAAALITAGGAAAQGVGLTPQSDQPIEIVSDESVEWHQKEMIYLARGNAVATRGDTRIRADLLRAHYRKEEGGNKIWKVEAIGGVVITAPQQTINGQKGVYVVDTGIFTLTGNNLRMVTEKQVITARDRIEYDSNRRVASVVGNAVVVEDDKRISASRFDAHFEDDKDGNNSIRRVDAVGGVVIVTKAEVIRGDRGTYDAETRIAVLTGDVRLTRGDDQLNCDRAEVNMETEVSKMTGRCRVIVHSRTGEEEKTRKGPAAGRPGAGSGAGGGNAAPRGR